MLLQRIADYAVAERTTMLPDGVIHHAKRALLDWFAALLPGTREQAAAILRESLAEELGPGDAEIYGLGRRGPLRAAALVNGATSHIVEFDDIFRDGLYHPGCPTIAAALAAAQAERAPGERLLRAIVVGYEISTRIAVAVVPGHYRYWHTTGTVGTFGAAAAVGTVLGLDRAQMAHALATAATMAAGLQQAFRSDAMSKPLHAGHAAEAGALAAMLARKGFTGALDVLDGPAGFGAALGGAPDWSRATEGLGRRYNITTMTSKNHGCCGHAFAAIDGALALRARYSLAPDRIRRLRVGTYRTAVEVTGSAEPRTPFEAKFSLAYVVATALVHGSVRLDAFGPERLADPTVRDLMRRIVLEVEPELDAQFPKRRAALVEIETAEGERLRHLQPTRRGDPEAPLSDAELEAKFFELASPVVGAEAARALRDEIAVLDGAASTGLHL